MKIEDWEKENRFGKQVRPVESGDYYHDCYECVDRPRHKTELPCRECIRQNRECDKDYFFRLLYLSQPLIGGGG